MRIACIRDVREHEFLFSLHVQRFSFGLVKSELERSEKSSLLNNSTVNDTGF